MKRPTSQHIIMKFKYTGDKDLETAVLNLGCIFELPRELFRNTMFWLPSRPTISKPLILGFG